LNKILPNQLQKILNEVNVLFSRGNLEASEKILNELIVSYPSHPEVLSKLGIIYLYQDKLENGIELIKKSLEANPYQADVLNNYAVALLNTNQSKEALDVINIAIQLKPNYVDAYFHQGLIYKSLGLFDHALKAYHNAIRLMPSHEKALINCSGIYIQLEKYHDAISILNNAKMSHFSLGFFYNLGLAHLKLQHFIEANELFRHVLNKDPNYTEAWNNLGLALKGLDQMEEALQCINKAIALNNEYAEAYDNKGLILLGLEKFSEALVQFQIALKLKPDDWEIYNNIGIAYMKLEQFDNALMNYNLSLKFNPKYADAFNNRALIYQEQLFFDKALSDFNEAIRIKPLYAEAINNRALIYQEQLFFDKALSDFNEAIRIKPLYAEAINNRGLLFKDQRLYNKAILDIKHAFKLNSKLSDINFNLSMIYLLQLNFYEGWKCYEKRQKVFDYLKKTQDLEKNYLTKAPNDQEPVLLHSEQGLGDQIIYLSLLHEVVNWSNPILAQIDPRLIPLFKRSFPAINFYSDKENLDPSLYKHHALVGSLPQFFRNSKESFLNQKKIFLLANQSKTSILRKQLTADKKIVCGISWKSKNEKFGHFKTATLNDFLLIFKLQSINFLDLQYGDTFDERSDLKSKHGITVTKIDDIDNFNDIDGLASLIDACDFIVTISNVTAHIAGALGKKVFLIVPYEKGKIWYWHDGLKQSLWYPTIEIYTQSKTGDWSEAIKEVHQKIVSEITL
jgi:tetratricopeptide (TPR) repeat protein